MGYIMPIRVLCLEHALVPTDDFERTREFYGHVLGLRTIPPLKSGYDFGVASFECAQNQVNLIRRDPNLDTYMTTHPKIHFNASMQPHLGFEVEDIVQCREELDKGGYSYYAVGEEGVIGRSCLFVRDPGGFVVELFEVLSTSSK
jgi:catechol 2,3-dioxygenase-like lactoylglutathione lyase family enzyme